jgi:hypothetical protein
MVRGPVNPLMELNPLTLKLQRDGMRCIAAPHAHVGAGALNDCSFSVMMSQGSQ